MDRDVHIIPVDDLREHVEGRSCWCGPDVLTDAPGADPVVVHHSADGREWVERHGIQ